MPLFIQALVAWSRRRPALALLGSGLLGWLVYWQVSPTSPVPRPVVAKAQTVPGLGAERAVMKKTLLDVQKENASLKGTLQEQDRTLRQIQQALVTSEKERQAAATAQEQRLEEVLKRAQQAHHVQQASASRPALKQQSAAGSMPKGVMQPSSEHVPGKEHRAKIHILRSKEAASFAGPPPSVNRADTPFLPAGSFAEGRVITGVMATSRAGGALPVLFSVSTEFHAPFQLQGSGLNQLETALPIQGCFALRKAQADLGSSRVIMQLELLSCV